MRKYYIISLFVLMACLGCQWQMQPSAEAKKTDEVVIDRFDQVEISYLTMADYAALHQMRTDYPVQTRTLIENLLCLGPVNDPEINNTLLVYFQDSILQVLIKDVEQQYASLDDVNHKLTEAFRRLSKMLPDIEIPKIYAQIGSLDQSIVVADSMLGVSLDKYLGADYSVYLRYGYSEQQRRTMTRDYIVPDCLGFYLLSLYPLPEAADTLIEQRRWHMMKIQYVVNQAMGRPVFSNDTITLIEKFTKAHPKLTTDELLLLDSLP